MSTAATLDLDTDTDALDARALEIRRDGWPISLVAKRLGLTIPSATAAVARAERRELDDLADARQAKRIVLAVFRPEKAPGKPEAETARLRSSFDPFDAEESAGWLILRRWGWSVADIADEADAPPSIVLHGIAAAQRREVEQGRRVDQVSRAPRCEPVFPMGGVPFTPSSPCPHRGPIPKGDRRVCVVCHKSGIDDHSALVIGPGELPRREPKPEPETKDERNRKAKRIALARRLAAGA